jgi:hypothetical protein
LKVKKVLGQEARQALQELLGDELEPAVAKQVRSLIRNLAANDVELTVQDLAELSHAVMGLESRETLTIAPESTGPVVISDEAGESLVGVCYGPEPGGHCPWAAEDGHLPCDGLWIASQGWQFKVAQDASEVCPLAVVLRDEVPERRE